MQELSNAKLSSAYLNGLKDSLNSGGQAGGSDANHAIQDLLRAASLLGGFGFGAGALSGLPTGSQPSGKSSSTPHKTTDHSGASKTESNPASKTNNDQQSSNKSTPTPENGQARTSDHRGNGKSTHDEASEESGTSFFFFPYFFLPFFVPFFSLSPFLTWSILDRCPYE